MPQGMYHVPHLPKAINEPTLEYKSKSPERTAVKAVIMELKSKELDIPMIIGGKEVRTENRISIHPPHEIKHTIVMLLWKRSRQ